MCTRCQEEPTCRDCRTIRASLPESTPDLWDLARIMANPPSALAAPLAFGEPVRSSMQGAD
ncbi:hypothetical protein M2164_000111 [Streptomyces sp. SAI-208]|nr:hypothetical protein [Streptomyces sp. SAI-208]